MNVRLRPEPLAVWSGRRYRSGCSVRDLLRVLTAPDPVRADVVRQFHERGDADMVDLLVLLEEQEWSRQAMIEELRRVGG